MTIQDTRCTIVGLIGSLRIPVKEEQMTVFSYFEFKSEKISHNLQMQDQL